MLHTKAWLVDSRPGLGGLAYVGSSNATQRSHIQDNVHIALSTNPGHARGAVVPALPGGFPMAHLSSKSR